MLKNSKKHFSLKKYLTFYNVYIVFCFLTWLTFSIYFLFSTKEGIPPDESYHLGIIRQFKNTPFLLKDNETSYQFGQISRTPFLYHFLASKTLILNNLFNIPELYFLRMISNMMGIIYFILALKFIKIASSNKLTHLLFMTIVTFTTMLPYLFSSVHYDNSVNLLSLISFILIFLLYKSKDLHYALYVFLVGLVGVLVKSTFAPLLLCQILGIFFLFIKNQRDSHIRSFFQRILEKKLLVTVVVLLFVINTYYFGINIYKYGTPFAKCTDVLTHEQCLKNGIYRRGIVFSKSDPMKPSTSSLLDYYYIWQKRMIGSLYGIYSHQTLGLNDTFVAIILIIFNILKYLFIIRLARKVFSSLDYSFLMIVALYIGIIFYTNYNSYLISGIPVATQGRYLLPIIIPLYYLISKVLTHGYKLIIINKVVIFVIFYILLQNTFRDLLHKSLLAGNYYAPKYSFTKTISKVNEAVPFIRLQVLLK